MKINFRTLLNILTVFSIALTSTLASASVVEVPGSSLPTLLGKPISAIRVLAKNSAGKILPIPFQVDERAAEGAPWFLDQTSPATPGLGTLDGQDVLLLIDDDGGVSAPPNELPPATERFEIVSNGKLIYILLQDENAPKSTKTHVSYNASQDRVSTAFYEAGFQSRSPLIQDLLILRNAGTATDILDRFKVRFKLAIKNFFDFKITEGDVESRLVGTRTGPIRVIRRVVATKKIGPINLVPKSQTDFIFYPNWLEVPTKIQNPIDGPKFLEDKTTGFSGYDFSKNVYGSQIYSSLGGAPLPLNGGSTPQAKILPGALEWWALTGPLGSFVVAIHNDPKLAQAGVSPILMIHDDAQSSSPPESEAGESFVGFDLPYHKIPKGTYMLQVKQVFPYRFDPTQVGSYLEAAKTAKPTAVKAL